MRLAPDALVASRHISDVLRREVRACGPAWSHPYRLQMLDIREGTTSDVRGLSTEDAWLIAGGDEWVIEEGAADILLAQMSESPLIASAPIDDRRRRDVCATPRDAERPYRLRLVDWRAGMLSASIPLTETEAEALIACPGWRRARS